MQKKAASKGGVFSYCVLVVISKSDSDRSGSQCHVTIVKKRLRHDKSVSILIKRIFGIQNSRPFVSDITHAQINFKDRVGVCKIPRRRSSPGTKREAIWHRIGVGEIHPTEHFITTRHGISILEMT